jgi:hypothetical protein
MVAMANMVWCACGNVLRSKSVEEFNLLPPMGSNLRTLHIRGSSGSVTAW